MNRYEVTITGLLIALTFFIAIQMLMVKAPNAHGANYVYNFSKDEKQEFNLMVLCYGDGIGIDLHELTTTNGIPLQKWCAERYGGIDTDYGEAIK